MEPDGKVGLEVLVLRAWPENRADSLGTRFQAGTQLMDSGVEH